MAFDATTAAELFEVMATSLTNNPGQINVTGFSSQANAPGSIGTSINVVGGQGETTGLSNIVHIGPDGKPVPEVPEVIRELLAVAAELRAAQPDKAKAEGMVARLRNRLPDVIVALATAFLTKAFG